MITLSQTQAAVYEYLKDICDSNHPLPSIVEISVRCNQSYGQAQRAVLELYRMDIVERQKSDHCQAQVYWLAQHDLEYTVSYHREISERCEIVRTWQQMRDYGY